MSWWTRPSVRFMDIEREDSIAAEREREIARIESVATAYAEQRAREMQNARIKRIRSTLDRLIAEQNGVNASYYDDLWEKLFEKTAEEPDFTAPEWNNFEI